LPQPIGNQRRNAGETHLELVGRTTGPARDALNLRTPEAVERRLMTFSVPSSRGAYSAVVLPAHMRWKRFG
jgi:hypothetical protein